MALRKSTTYGAKGDGIADDTVALQKMADATKPGDTADFVSEKKKYRVTKQIWFKNSDIQIWGRNAPIISDTSNYPDNTAIRIGTPGYNDPARAKSLLLNTEIREGWLDLRSYPWPGYLMLGTDPWDANEEHFGQMIPLGADRVYVPYAIKGINNKFVPLIRSPERPSGWQERVHIRDLNFQQAPKQVTNAHLWVDGCKHVTIDGIRGDVTIGLQTADVQHLIVRNVDVRLIYNHSASARAISMWNTSDFLIDGVKIVGNNLPPRTSRGFFLESHCTRGHITNVKAAFNMVGRSWGDTVGLFHITGGSSHINVGHVAIHDPSLIDLWSQGGAPPAGHDQAMPEFDVVEGHGNTDLLKQYKEKGWLLIRRLVTGEYNA